MSVIVAIGGGELKELETLPIDRAIVRLTGKKRPKALFVPTASNDALGYWEIFQDVYGKRLGCETDVLFLVREKLSRKQIEKKIFSADLIYVGGGDSLRMLRVWRKYGVDKLLRKVYEKGVILSGLSAGAIAWFRYGSSHSRRFTKKGKRMSSFVRVSALGFLPFTVSPHHIREKLRTPEIVEMMKRTPGIGLALDDNAAILIQGSRYKILRSKANVGIDKVFQKKGKIERGRLKESGSLEDLSAKSG